jgi:hypothetical protein
VCDRSPDASSRRPCAGRIVCAADVRGSAQVYFPVSAGAPQREQAAASGHQRGPQVRRSHCIHTHTHACACTCNSTNTWTWTCTRMCAADVGQQNGPAGSVAAAQLGGTGRRSGTLFLSLSLSLLSTSIYSPTSPLE